MKVVYTHDAFTSQRYGGVSRYFCELIKRVSAMGAEVQVLAGPFINEYVRALPGVRGLKVPVINHTGFMRRIIGEVYQGVILRRSVPETIVHQTYYSEPSKKRGAKWVVTVYDMVHELFPEHVPGDDEVPRLKKLCCENADAIIAISHSTKNDLVRLCGIDSRRITVIHLGSPLKDWSGRSDSKVFSMPYLLFVGKRDGYKNFARLIHAFAVSERLKGNFHVVCFGGEGFSVAERRKLAQLGIERLVHHVRGDDEVLVKLYRHATAFVCPSLYEGFGIPILEAMSLACPVVCSRTSSIPEVAGDAAAYFDPCDVASIRQTLEEAMSSSSIHDSIARGLSRASLFTWDRCAQETLALYRSLLN
jgi:glycosyltransferase involved in cell wall biosynthesis